MHGTSCGSAKFDYTAPCVQILILLSLIELENDTAE
jgi:hypothetical protein